MSAVRRVGFVVNEHTPEARPLVESLGGFLRERGVEFFGERDNAEALGLTPAPQSAFCQADLCVVLGGDGTLLRAARLLGDGEVPLFGVHLGSLGFMTEIPVDDALPLLSEVIEGRFETQPRVKLAVSLCRDEDHGTATGKNDSAVQCSPSGASQRPFPPAQVLNEAVVMKGALSRIIELDTRIDGLPVASFRADGVIVSTPTGSTGYSLSAAGPILDPTLSAILVTPICPHTLAQRPLVVPGNRRVELSLRPGCSEVFLTLDGQLGWPLRPRDRVRIEVAPSRVMLVRNPRLDFFTILRSRLGWGGGR